MKVEMKAAMHHLEALAEVEAGAEGGEGGAQGRGVVWGAGDPGGGGAEGVKIVKVRLCTLSLDPDTYVHLSRRFALILVTLILGAYLGAYLYFKSVQPSTRRQCQHPIA